MAKKPTFQERLDAMTPMTRRFDRSGVPVRCVDGLHRLRKDTVETSPGVFESKHHDSGDNAAKELTAP